jgi:hypothetical protein
MSRLARSWFHDFRDIQSSVESMIMASIECRLSAMIAVVKSYIRQGHQTSLRGVGLLYGGWWDTRIC